MDSYVVRKCLLGVEKSQPPRIPHRLPVTPSLLSSIHSALPLVLESAYEVSLFRAVFLLAFFAFLRVSEFTRSPHALELADILMISSAVKITFCSYKFSSNHVSQILLPAIPSPLCPVRALASYLRLRSPGGGQLFLSSSSNPLGVGEVRNVLSVLSSHLNLHKGCLTSHSFRIGAATTAAAIGISDEAIMRMGRWSSSAFRKYIRCQVNQF